VEEEEVTAVVVAVKAHTAVVTAVGVVAAAVTVAAAAMADAKLFTSCQLSSQAQ